MRCVMALFDALANLFSGNPTSTQLSSGETINWNAPQDSFLAPLANFVRPASRALQTFNQVLTNSDPEQAQPLSNNNIFSNLAGAVDRMQTPTSSNALKHLSALAGAAPQLYSQPYASSLANLANPDRNLETNIKQAQLDALTKQKPDFDIEKTAKTAVLKKYLGAPLDEYDNASLQAMAAIEPDRTTYTKDLMGNLIPQTTQSPYAKFVSGLTGQVGQQQATVAQPVQPQPVQTPALVDYQALAALEDWNADKSGAQDMITFSDGLVPELPASQIVQQPLSGSALPVAPNMPLATQNLPVGVDVGSPLYQATVTEETAKNVAESMQPLSELAQLQADEDAGRVPEGTVDRYMEVKEIALRKEKQAVEKVEKAAKEKEKQEKQAVDIATKKLSEARNQLEKWGSSGFSATVGLALPGKAANADTMESIYKTLRSTLTLDKLLELKAASPTGATGFGAINMKELELLTSAVEDLDTELPYEVQVEKLNTIDGILGKVAPKKSSELLNSGGWSIKVKGE